MHSIDNLSDAMFMVEPARMVWLDTTLSTANVTAVPKTVAVEAVDNAAKVVPATVLACAAQVEVGAFTAPAASLIA